MFLKYSFIPLIPKIPLSSTSGCSLQWDHLPPPPQSSSFTPAWKLFIQHLFTSLSTVASLYAFKLLSLSLWCIISNPGRVQSKSQLCNLQLGKNSTAADISSAGVFTAVLTLIFIIHRVLTALLPIFCSLVSTFPSLSPSDLLHILSFLRTSTQHSFHLLSTVCSLISALVRIQIFEYIFVSYWSFSYVWLPFTEHNI